LETVVWKLDIICLASAKMLLLPGVDMGAPVRDFQNKPDD
jgi:hypothetical protein